MIMTKRDREILSFINEFGFCEITQLEKKFSLKKPRCYQIMQRLMKENLVIHKKVFHGRNGIFYLSRLGASYTCLPIIPKIPVAIYDHQLAVIEIYFKLMQEYLDAKWISERHLKRERTDYGIGRVKHIPDGIMILPDDQLIAIEVELTMKSKRRIEPILRGYGGTLKFKEAWYFCAPDVLARMRKAVGMKSFIKVFSLSDDH